MKKLFIAILMMTSVFTYANANKGGEEEKTMFFEKLKSLVLTEKIVDALHLEGEANVWVVVDETGTVHVEDVDTGNYANEFHIRQSLEGIKMQVSESLVGKTFSMVIDFVKSNNAEQPE